MRPCCYDTIQYIGQTSEDYWNLEGVHTATFPTTTLDAGPPRVVVVIAIFTNVLIGELEKGLG